MEFTTSDWEKFVTISDLYMNAKAIILLSEEIDPESKSNLQVIKELRDAFDHIMILLINSFFEKLNLHIVWFVVAIVIIQQRLSKNKT